MIEKLINDAIQKEQDARKDRVRSGMWNPSSFGCCFRSQYWNRKNVEPSDPKDARTLKLFKAGKLFHDFVQGLLTEVESEVEVKTFDTFGYADIVLEDTVIDIKSQHSRAFWYMEKSNYDVFKEKRHNWLQVAHYARILGKPKCGLFFISKDDLWCAEYYSNTDFWTSALDEEMTQLRHFWNTDTLPPAEPRAFSTECKYCSYLTKCKGKKNGNSQDSTVTGTVRNATS